MFPPDVWTTSDAGNRVATPDDGDIIAQCMTMCARQMATLVLRCLDMVRRCSRDCNNPVNVILAKDEPLPKRPKLQPYQSPKTVYSCLLQANNLPRRKQHGQKSPWCRSPYLRTCLGRRTSRC